MESYALTDGQRQQVEQWLCGCPGAAGRNVLSALSYNLRRVIELRYGLADGHHYSVQETADVFEKPVAWVAEVESGAFSMLYQFLAPGGRPNNSQ